MQAPPLNAHGIDPRCGRCGYIVRGLARSICPECGSDLREVGVRRGDPWVNFLRRHRFALRVAACVAWTLCVMRLGPDLGNRLAPHLARQHLVRAQRSLDLPSSSAYQSLTIAVEGAADVRPIPPRNLRLTFVLRKQPGPMDSFGKVFEVEVDPVTWVRRPADGGAGVGSAHRFGMLQVVAWMNEAGVNTASESIREEILTALGTAEQLVATQQPMDSDDHRGFLSAECSVHTHVRTPPWLLALGFVAWPATALLGTLVILRLTRRRRRPTGY
jgi:hypothetical protein